MGQRRATAEALELTYRGGQVDVGKLIEHGVLQQLGANPYGRAYVALDTICALRDAPVQAQNDTE